jgi:hypothetical protein
MVVRLAVDWSSSEVGEELHEQKRGVQSRVTDGITASVSI